MSWCLAGLLLQGGGGFKGGNTQMGVRSNCEGWAGSSSGDSNGLMEMGGLNAFVPTTFWDMRCNVIQERPKKEQAMGIRISLLKHPWRCFFGPIYNPIPPPLAKNPPRQTRPIVYTKENIHYLDEETASLPSIPSAPPLPHRLGAPTPRSRQNSKNSAHRSGARPGGQVSRTSAVMRGLRTFVWMKGGASGLSADGGR